VAQSPRRSCRLQGLDPLPLQSEDDIRPALQLVSVNPPEINRQSTSQSSIEIRSEGNPFSTPIPDSLVTYPVEYFFLDVAIPDYSIFSFELYTSVTIDDLTSEADQLSVNQGLTRAPYLTHYNQPLTDPSGPIIEQLTEPSVLPWRNNT